VRGGGAQRRRLRVPPPCARVPEGGRHAGAARGAARAAARSFERGAVRRDRARRAHGRRRDDARGEGVRVELRCAGRRAGGARTGRVRRHRRDLQHGVALPRGAGSRTRVARNRSTRRPKSVSVRGHSVQVDHLCVSSRPALGQRVSNTWLCLLIRLPPRRVCPRCIYQRVSNGAQHEQSSNWRSQVVQRVQGFRLHRPR